MAGRWMQSPPEYSGVYDSELLAIMAALRHVVAMTGIRTRVGLPSITVVSDSQSAARALQQIEIWHSLDSPLSMATDAIHDARQALAPGETISLRWVPGHRDIKGNE